MAKRSRKGGPNKSLLIREYMAQHPDEGPQAVAAALKAEHGVEVTAQFVSTIKSNDRRKAPTGAKRGRKPGAVVKAAAGHDLIVAKKFIDQIGGVDKAKAAVELLAQLLG